MDSFVLLVVEIVMLLSVLMLISLLFSVIELRNLLSFRLLIGLLLVVVIVRLDDGLMMLRILGLLMMLKCSFSLFVSVWFVLNCSVLRLSNLL